MASPASPSAYRTGPHGFFLVAGIVVALMFVAAQSAAASFSVQQLTDDTADDTSPDVSGQYVVWQSFVAGSGYEIFQYDGSQTRQITNDDRTNISPRASGTAIAWASGDPASTATGGLSYYDGTSASQILPASTGASPPDISGQTVVYTAPGTYDPAVPASYGSADVYRYNGGSLQNVTNDSDDEAGARIDGARMVWMQHGPTAGSWASLALGYGTNSNPIALGKGGEVVLDDAGAVSVLSGAGQNALDPSVSSSAVAWSAWDGHDLEIYVYRNGQTTEISHNETEDRLAQVSDRGVAWTGWDGNDYEIYYYDFATDSTIQLTSNAENDLLGGISGSSVTWQGYDGHDWEIYVATVPEPSVSLLLGLVVAALAAARWWA